MPSYGLENSISAGTTITVRMVETIDSRVHKAGDHFTVTTEGDIKKDQQVIIKSGSQAQVIINKIQTPGRGQQSSRLILILTMLNANNRQIYIKTFPITEQGTTPIGTKIVAIDKNKNVVIGKQSGKITTSPTLMTKGSHIMLTKGTVLEFILKEPIPL